MIPDVSAIRRFHSTINVVDFSIVYDINKESTHNEIKI